MPERVELAFDRPVPRQLVHRASVCEVFLTDDLTLGGERFLVGAQWPRNHSLYHPDQARRCDFMLVAETVRQAGLYLSHQAYDVPLGHAFIFRGLDVHIDDLAPLCLRDRPLNAVLDITCTRDPRSKEGFPAHFDAVITVDGRPCARASVGVLVTDKRRYQMLRTRGRDPQATSAGPPAAAGLPVPTELSGRRRPENLLLRTVPTDPPHSWRLHLDTAHAGYFEHASDHVPGMVLLEAFRQAGHVMTSTDGPTVLTSLSTEFAAFGELDEYVMITAAADSARSAVELTATQGQRVLATATASYVPCTASL
jgi:hypothetical protein